MSLAGFVGGFSQGFMQGRALKSADAYRQSIINMRNLQIEQQEAVDTDQKQRAYTSLTGAMMANKITPGMTALPGALGWAKQNLPAPQYNQIMANAAKQGWTSEQLASMQAAPPEPPGQPPKTWLGRAAADLGFGQGHMPAAQGPSGDFTAAGAAPAAAQQGIDQDTYMQDMANAPSGDAGVIPQGQQAGQPAISAIPMIPSNQYNADGTPVGSPAPGAGTPQYAQPVGQARGGVVPVQHRAAGGGVIDPDISAAVGQANAQTDTRSAQPAQASAGVLPVPNAGPAPMPAPAPGAPPAVQAAPPTPAAAPQGVLPAGGPPAPPPQGAPPVAVAHNIPQGHPMTPMHPPGLQAPADPSAPLNVPAAAMVSQTPAQAAMKHGQIALGLHPSQTGSQPQPQSAANYTELQHGAGASSNAMVQAARAKVSGGDPSAPLGIQNASLINNLYNYDLENHGPAVAAADSFAVLQNFRVNMQLYGGAAVSSMQAGNTAAAAHYLQQAYAFFPDGNEVDVAPGPNGSLQATRKTADGKVVDTSAFANADDLTKFVMGTSSFENYNTYLDNAQKLALQTANVNNEMSNRDASTGLRAQEVGNEGAYQQGELANDAGHLSNDTARTNFEVNGGKGKQPAAPSASAMSSAGTDISNLVEADPGQGASSIMKRLGLDQLSPQQVDTVTSLATDLSAYNGLPAAQALTAATAVLRDPGKFYDGTTLKVHGQPLRFGPASGMILNQFAPPTQAKAKGGVITPAARAMAAL